MSLKKTEQSMEDYLEAILILGMKLPAVRSVDVANELGFILCQISKHFPVSRGIRQVTGAISENMP